MFEFMRSVFDKIPYQVIVSVFVVIVCTENTKNFFAGIEKKLEAKKGKEIKFFDHTKIVFSLFWSLVLTVSFAVGNIYTWAELPLYFLFVVGGSTTFYELVWKRKRKDSSI